MKMRFCPECGHKIPENARFCPECGFALSIDTQTKGPVNENAEETASQKEPADVPTVRESEDDLDLDSLFDEQVKRKQGFVKEIQTANLFVNLGNYDAALPHYQSVLREDPKNIDCVVGKICCLSEGYKKEYPEAKKDVQELLKIRNKAKVLEKFPELAALISLIEGREAKAKTEAILKEKRLAQEIPVGAELQLGFDNEHNPLHWRVIEARGSMIRAIASSPIFISRKNLTRRNFLKDVCNALDETLSFEQDLPGLKCQTPYPNVNRDIILNVHPEKGEYGVLLPSVDEMELFYPHKSQRDKNGKYIFMTSQAFHHDAVFYHNGSLECGELADLYEDCDIAIYPVLIVARKPVLDFIYFESAPVAPEGKAYLEFGRYENIAIRWNLLKKEGEFTYYLARIPTFWDRTDPIEPSKEWAKSELRKFLNETFLERAFEESQRARLAPVDEGDSLISLPDIYDPSCFNDFKDVEDFPPCLATKALAILDKKEDGEDLIYQGFDTNKHEFSDLQINLKQGFYPLIRLCSKEGFDFNSHTFKEDSSSRFQKMRDALALREKELCEREEENAKFCESIRYFEAEIDDKDGKAELIGFSHIYFIESPSVVVVPDGVKSISDLSSAGVEEVVFDSDHLEVIGNEAFSPSDRLKKLTFKKPGKLTIIGNEAFLGCKNLDEIVSLPDSVTCIGSQAFGSTAISTFEIPADLEVIMADAFKDCRNFSGFVGENKNFFAYEGILFKGKRGSSSVVLECCPDLPCKKLDLNKFPFPISGCAFDAFTCCHTLKTVVLPKGCEKKKFSSTDVDMIEKREWKLW